jgi:hypothetical protein
MARYSTITPEEAYEEALSRIREAEKTGALELDYEGNDTGEPAISNWLFRFFLLGLYCGVDFSS